MNTAKALQNFGKNIAEMRKSKIMSQMQLGVRIRVSQVTIQRIEKGHISGLRLETLLCLATALDCHASDLFFEIEKNSHSDSCKSFVKDCSSQLKLFKPSQKPTVASIVLKLIE